MPKHIKAEKKVWTPQMIQNARIKHADRTAVKKAAAAAKKAADEAADAYRKYWKGVIGADPEYFNDRESQRINLTVAVYAVELFDFSGII